jgi:hypothetical protein
MNIFFCKKKWEKMEKGGIISVVRVRQCLVQQLKKHLCSPNTINHQQVITATVDKQENVCSPHTLEYLSRSR